MGFLFACIGFIFIKCLNRENVNRKWDWINKNDKNLSIIITLRRSITYTIKYQ